MVYAAEDAILFSLATTFRLTLMVVMASSVSKQVQNPSSKLLTNQMGCGKDWSLLGQLRKLVDEFSNTTGIDLASLGHEDHVTLHISGSLVVLAMGNFPREIWNEKS